MNSWVRFSILILLGAVPLRAESIDYDTRSWFKGNTHTHSLWSDGNDFPEMIFDWYRRNGYHFVAMSDHITADELATVAECRYMEIYNGHPGINHLGDKTRPGDLEIWDIANTIRIAEMHAEPLLGFATDDSHTYHGGDVSPGRGWIHVGSEELTGDSIVSALLEGRFYASSGVELETIRFDEETRELTLEVKPETGCQYGIAFVGTRRGYDATAEKTGIGEVFATTTGNRAVFRMPEDALYLRATVTSSRRHPYPSYRGQMEQAWIQPVGWR